MSRDGKSYYKDLEKNQPDQAPGFRPIAPTQKVIYIPWSRIFLILILGYLIYLWQDDKFRYDPRDPNSGRPPALILALEKMYFKIYNAVTGKAIKVDDSDSATAMDKLKKLAVEGHAEEKKSSLDPAELASQADLNAGNFVQIRGKYYRYHSDNVYMIGGERVYYEDIRHRVPTAPDTTKKEVAH